MYLHTYQSTFPSSLASSLLILWYLLFYHQVLGSNFIIDFTYEWDYTMLNFCSWFILLNKMISRSIPVIINGRFSFYSWIAFHQLCRCSESTYQDSRNLGLFFSFLAVIRSAAIYVGEQMPLQHVYFPSFVYLGEALLELILLTFALLIGWDGVTVILSSISLAISDDEHFFLYSILLMSTINLNCVIIIIAVFPVKDLEVLIYFYMISLLEM